MKKITIVSATPHSYEDFKKTPLFKSLKKMQEMYNLSIFDYNIIPNNNKGLSVVYNSFLKNPLYAKNILVFVHDDLVIEDLFFLEKVNNSPYIVTGLAGCNSIDLNKPPAWHIMSTTKNNMLGEVAHINSKEETWTTVFGPTKGRALLIDGLFFAIDVEKFLPFNVFFDEDFNFHHYDLSFCLRCNTNQISVGVLPIKVTHYGLGDSMFSTEWKTSAKLFKEKYC